MTTPSLRGSVGTPRPRTLAALFLIWIAACAASGGPASSPPEAGGPERLLGDDPARAEAGEPAAVDTAEEEGGDGEALPIHGSLWTRFRGRRTDDADDADLYTTLSLDIGKSDRNAFTGHVMGRAWWDLGGSGTIFSGLEDTHSGDLSAKLYHAYVDAHEIESLDLARVGRQQMWETPEFVVFDGVRLETEELGPGIELGAYGGIPAHFYESSSAGDSVFGAFGQARPWSGGRMRLDWMYLDDDNRLGQHQNDLLGLSVWHSIGKEITLEGEYTRLEGRDRDARLTANYADANSDFTLQVSVYTLLEEQRDFALEADPFFASLKELSPYNQVGFLASKSLGKAVTLDVGADVRRLDDESDEAEFNHEFEHYFANATLPKMLRDGLALTLSADYWEDDQQDVSTWGADLTHEIDEQLRASLGTYYSLYKYDLFLDSERDDVRTYYLKLRYKRSAALTCDVALEYEDDDFEEYMTMRLGARWRF